MRTASERIDERLRADFMTSTAPRIKTQTDHVLDYMRTVGPITPLDAENAIGCRRLGARVWDLKQRGIEIRTEMVTVPTRTGTTRVARYSLVSDEQKAAARTAAQARA